MPLTNEERAFLDAYVYEVTHGPPFGGPATTDLKQSGIHYRDLGWILTAYQREVCARGGIPDGVPNRNPPPNPWQSAAQVKLRNDALKHEWEPLIQAEAANHKGSRNGPAGSATEPQTTEGLV